MRAYDSEGLLLAYVVGEFGVHEVRPDGAASPQKPSGKRIAPGEVIDGACSTREKRRRLVTVEHDAAEVQHVEYFHIEIFRNNFWGVVGVSARRLFLAHELERLSDGVGGAAVAGAD